ncbi:MAG: hypothetical protein ACFFB3_06595 [Candidatus Hodarchaeota archaeon]
MMKTKIIDPVDKDKREREESEDIEQLKMFDIGNLTMADFHAVKATTAHTPHPFDGYPYPKGKEAAFIVGLNPTKYIPQDPSSRNLSMIVKGKEKKVTIETTHNRVIQDFDKGGINTDVVFDRKMNLSDGNILYYALVPSHSVRAQLIFEYDARAERIKVNPDYLLIDTAQAKRLRRLYEIIINPKLKKEQMSAYISGEREEEPSISGSLLESA